MISLRGERESAPFPGRKRCATARFPHKKKLTEEWSRAGGLGGWQTPVSSLNSQLLPIHPLMCHTEVW